MSLNIKDEETHSLVRELAELTGESMTAAVKASVKERLERRRLHEKEGLAEWLDEITKHTAEALKDLPSSDKIGDLLFDKETGLPL
jgi:antitoxin VapB